MQVFFLFLFFVFFFKFWLRKYFWFFFAEFELLFHNNIFKIQKIE